MPPKKSRELKTPGTVPMRFEVEPDIRQRMKIVAAKRGVTMTALLTVMLEREEKLIQKESK